jgi:hypothetical protein
MNTTPLYARLTAALSRPLVLIAALVISMPAEIQLAQAAGFRGGYAYLMPLTLSMYSAASAIIAANRPRGAKGRVSAIIGSGASLGMALSAQVVGHLISSGYMTSGPVLVSLVSSVPALAACHMLHLGSMPKSAVGVTDVETGQENEEEPVNGTPQKVSARPSKGRSLRPALQAIREAAQSLEKAGKRVTGPALAEVFNVHPRTGARYRKMIAA